MGKYRTTVLFTQVGWDESKLDQEELHRKNIIAKMMDSHAVQKKAALKAAHIVAALDGEKHMPPNPPLVVRAPLGY